MKTKIILTIVFLASLAYEASAFKIIISGGTRRNKFDYVEIDDFHCTCKGNGNNECPVRFPYSQVKAITTWFPTNDIIDYVFLQVKEGKTKGETLFGKELPVRWTSSGDNTVEIDLDNSDIRGTIPIYEKK